jgi:hypothetical protein
LLDDSKVLLVTLGVQIREVLISILDTTSVRVVESLNKLNDGRLTTTTATNKCNCLVLLNNDLCLLDDLNVFLGWVGELNV